MCIRDRLLCYPTDNNGAGGVFQDCDTSKVGQWQRITLTTLPGFNYRAIALWGEPAWPSSAGPIEIFAPTSVSGTIPSSIQGSCDYSFDIGQKEGSIFAKYNELKIKKSKLVGSGSFNEIAFMSVDIRTSQDTQTIAYSEPAIVKNYDEEPKLQGGALVSLNTSVSVDDAASYFTKNEANLVLRKKYISDIQSFDLVDPLFFIKGLKFSDLPSWYDDCIFDFYETPKSTQYNLIRHFLYKVLAFVFPAEKIDTTFLLYTNDVEINGSRGNFVQALYYSIRSDQRIDELISTICKSLLCTIVFDKETGKIRVRSARETFNKLNNPNNPYRVLNSIISYGVDNTQQSEIVNTFTQTQWVALLNGVQRPESTRAYLGNAATLSELEPTGGKTKSIFISLDDVLLAPKSDNLFVQNIQISGLLLGDTPQMSAPPNNAGVVIRDIQLLGNSIKVLYINNNATPKYVLSMTLDAIYQHHGPLVSYNFFDVDNFTGTLPFEADFGDVTGLERNNDDSVKKYGKKEADLDFRFVPTFVSTYETGGALFALRIIPEAYYRVPDEDYSLIDLYGDSDIKDRVVLMNNDNYTVGDQVIYLDRDRVERIGIILETFVSDYTVELTIKRVQ